MSEILVLCEGDSEREFCNSVVAEHMRAHGVWVRGTLAGKPNKKQGGILRWEKCRREILVLGQQRSEHHVAVLVDYYAMPLCWPGREGAPSTPVEERGTYVESCLREDLQSELGTQFIPCVQLHEFESLIFVDPEISARYIAGGSGQSSHRTIADQLAGIRNGFQGRVERINDSPVTAPSKQIKGIVPGYDKMAWGVTAVREVGVDTLRQGCPWLDRWLGCLESTSQTEEA